MAIINKVSKINNGVNITKFNHDGSKAKPLITLFINGILAHIFEVPNNQLRKLKGQLKFEVKPKPDKRKAVINTMNV